MSTILCACPVGGVEDRRKGCRSKEKEEMWQKKREEVIIEKTGRVLFVDNVYKYPGLHYRCVSVCCVVFKGCPSLKFLVPS